MFDQLPVDLLPRFVELVAVQQQDHARKVIRQPPLIFGGERLCLGGTDGKDVHDLFSRETRTALRPGAGAVGRVRLSSPRRFGFRGGKDASFFDVHSKCRE